MKPPRIRKPYRGTIYFPQYEPAPAVHSWRFREWGKNKPEDKPMPEDLTNGKE